MSKKRSIQIRRLVQTWVVFLIALGALAVSQPGCQVFQRFRPTVNPAPVAFAETPNLQQIIARLNEQSKMVQQVSTEVTVAMDGIPGRLKGTLMVERPKRMRLKAGILGIKEMGVDVGSNDELFWVWSRANLPGQQQALYYADHLQYQSSQLKTMLPLEPTWLIDALGFVDFSPLDRHEGPYPREDGRYQIVTHHQSAGNSNIRVSVIDPKYGWIVQQSIYDSNHRILAYVNSIKHEYYPEANVSLPQEIVIYVYQPDGQKIKLTVDAEKYSINSIYGDPNRLWSIPNPQDVPKIDLTQVANVAVPTN